tara:strand:+ start:750 stop:920 length:171 start_codon:yes stop_codon:yes gene_type:complete
MRHNLLTISYPDNENTMDLKHELFHIKEKYGISKSKFVYRALKKEITRIKEESPLI